MRAQSTSGLLGIAVRAAASVGSPTSPTSGTPKSPGDTGGEGASAAVSGSITPRPSASMSNLRGSFRLTSVNMIQANKASVGTKDCIAFWISSIATE